MSVDEKTLQEKLKKIKLLVLDVDGVMTDGRILLNELGGEIRCFDVKDGIGIRSVVLSGLKVAVISGRVSEVVKRRCERLGVEDVYQGYQNKLEPLRKILEKNGIGLEETCYLGDDLIDVPVLGIVGLSACVADAVPEVKEICDYVCANGGGRGAVREVAQMILKAQGKWENILKLFIDEQ